jgi:uncharacterized integral membrane protein
MAKARVVEVHEETPREKALDEWYEKQALASPDRLEAAARTITGLVTALLSVLFGVLAVTEDPLPSFFWIPVVRPLGVTAVAALLVALVCALAVVLPRRIAVSRARPDEQAQAFEDLLAHKSRWLTAATIAFGLGLTVLGAVVVIALLRAV